MQNVSLVDQFFTKLKLADDGRNGQKANDTAADNRGFPAPPLQAKGLGAASLGLSVELSYSASQLTYTEQGNNRLITAQVFEARIGARLQVSNQKAFAPPQYAPNIPTPQDVANNILSFVENRLAREAASGASQDRLEELYNQGVAGIQRGYAEAMEEIEGRGLLTDELQEDIDTGYELVKDGLAALKEKYLQDDIGAESEKTPQVLTQPGSDLADEEDEQDEDRNTPAVFERSRLAEALAINRAEYSANNVGIQITTQDGDRVSIRVAQASGSAESLRYGRGEDSEVLAVSQNSIQLGGYELAIEGELDEGELEALEELLLQVEEIAGSFFSGDLDAAFEQALQMDVDMSEIANFAVSMSSVQYQSVEAAYQQKSPAVEAFKPFAELVPQFTNAIEQASVFDQSRQLLQDLLDRVLENPLESSGDKPGLYKSLSDNLLDRLFG